MASVIKMRYMDTEVLITQQLELLYTKVLFWAISRVLFWVLLTESTFLSTFLSTFFSTLVKEYFFEYFFEYSKKYSRVSFSFMLWKGSWKFDQFYQRYALAIQKTLCGTSCAVSFTSHVGNSCPAEMKSTWVFSVKVSIWVILGFFPVSYRYFWCIFEAITEQLKTSSNLFTRALSAQSS